MASFAKQFSLFILLISLSSSQARESQFFNKAPTTTTANDVVPQPYPKQPQNINPQEQPDFLPENQNAYGLYDHDSGHLHPSAATSNGGRTTTESKQPVHKYLPKSYSPVAEDINESTTFTDEKKRFTSNPDNNDFDDGAQNYYNTPHEIYPEYTNRYPSTTNNRDGNNYYHSGGALSGREDYFDHGVAGANGFEPQGMSDTRTLENGKYFYDVNTEKYSRNHPYESLKEGRERNEYGNRNYYGYGENGYELNGGKNSMGGYQNQYEFEENNNLRP